MHPLRDKYPNWVAYDIATSHNHINFIFSIIDNTVPFLEFHTSFIL
jgi:hypothetical protein